MCYACCVAGLYRDLDERPVEKQLGTSVFARLAILLVWYLGMTLALSLAAIPLVLLGEIGVAEVFFGTAAIVGLLSLFTLALPVWTTALWLGPKLRSARHRTALVYFASVVVTARMAQFVYESTFDTMTILPIVLLLSGLVALLAPSCLVSHLLGKVPRRDDSWAFKE